MAKGEKEEATTVRLFRSLGSFYEAQKFTGWCHSFDLVLNVLISVGVGSVCI